jgi:hypothetical protein
MQHDNLNGLLVFRAVAAERSFTRAAAKPGVSQSALSHTIRGRKVYDVCKGGLLFGARLLERSSLRGACNASSRVISGGSALLRPPYCAAALTAAVRLVPRKHIGGAGNCAAGGAKRSADNRTNRTAARITPRGPGCLSGDCARYRV